MSVDAWHPEVGDGQSKRQPLLSMSVSQELKEESESDNETKSVSNMQLLGGVVGNILEWYDFGTVGYLAEELAHNFFRGSHFVRMLCIYGVFAGAFFARPVGGAVFGKIGDQKGRKFAIQLSMAIMFTATFTIGCMPTYGSIGEFAPLLLLSLRLAQGFSAGGQFVGSFLVLLESSGPNERGFYSAVPQFTGGIGVVLSGGTVALMRYLMSEHSMRAFGWRIPFLLSGVLGVVGMVPQWFMEESLEFEQLKKRGEVLENPLATALSMHPKEIAAIVFAIAPAGISLYVVYVWLPNYISAHAYSKALAITVLMSLVTRCVPLLGGHCADKYHWFPVMRAATLALALCIVPVFWFMAEFKDEWYGITVAFAVSAPMASFFAGPMQLLMNDMIDSAAMRYTVIGIAYNISFSVFAGTSPMVSEAIAHIGLVYVGLYLAILAAFSYFVVSVVIAKMIPHKLPNAKRTAKHSRVADYKEVDALNVDK